MKTINVSPDLIWKPDIVLYNGYVITFNYITGYVITLYHTTAMLYIILYYTAGRLHRRNPTAVTVDTDVRSAVTAKMSKALWQRNKHSAVAAVVVTVLR